ncbi:AP-1-like transcription factor napA [Colletotrichum spinosum]|uniref:Putative transcription factor kapC n=1 Tax=Colletotrichum spinosum TaxID=1347390 RepID=A0A4R8PWR6_9PEZI|nr:AP-1-like transcription factor napA [Colletotrichum spinosum]
MDQSLPLHVLDEFDSFLDLEVPYGYEDPEQYLDTASSSETPSPIMSNFDMTFVSDFNGVDSSIYPSPMSSARDTASPQPTSDPNASATAAKQPAKRKRENRYKNAPPSVLSRRRAQNRASQRAYRERKDQRIKDLEVMLSEQKQKNDTLSQAYSALHAEYLKLRGAQTRVQHQHQQHQHMPRHPAAPMAFDQSLNAAAAHMGLTGGGHPGPMDYADNMYMFQDMQAYTL